MRRQHKQHCRVVVCGDPHAHTHTRTHKCGWARASSMCSWRATVGVPRGAGNGAGMTARMHAVLQPRRALRPEAGGRQPPGGGAARAKGMHGCGLSIALCVPHLYHMHVSHKHQL